MSSTDSFSPGERAGVRLRLLPLVLAAIVFTTAVPVEWRPALLEAPHFGVPDFVLNVLLYAPLGVALRRPTLGRALALGALLSGALEILQLWSTERHGSVFDVLANTLGTALGAAFAASRARRGRASTAAASLALDGRLMAGALVAAVLLLVAWAWPTQGSDLASWDRSFDLLLGNERTGDRPWRGRIEALALVPAALEARELGALTDLSAPQATARLAALGAHTVAGPLALAGGPAVRLPGTTTQRFFDETVAGTAFTVIVTLVTADTTQDGPARIVSFSRDTLQRNFDLGQEEARLMFRVRTAASGPNGMNVRAETADVLAPGRPVTVAASFDGRVARLYVDGRVRGRANLAAAACAVPPLCEVDLPLGTALFGACCAVLAVGAGQPRSRARAFGLALAAGVPAAALLHALHVGHTAALFEAWVVPAVLAGAACVGMAVGVPAATAARAESVPRERHEG